MKKLSLRYPLIVEGKYDKIKLSDIISSPIIETGGFALINNKKKRKYLYTLAQSTKFIVLTDSDKAGGFIRSHLKGIIPKDKLINVYIPKIEGKEKRKSVHSAEGLLGVEGMSFEVLQKLLSPYISEERQIEPVTPDLLWEAGLLGKNDSCEKRKILAKELDLPDNLTQKALTDAINTLGGASLFRQLSKKLFDVEL